MTRLVEVGCVLRLLVVVFFFVLFGTVGGGDGVGFSFVLVIFFFFAGFFLVRLFRRRRCFAAGPVSDAYVIEFSGSVGSLAGVVLTVGCSVLSTECVGGVGTTL